MDVRQKNNAECAGIDAECAGIDSEFAVGERKESTGPVADA